MSGYNKSEIGATGKFPDGKLNSQDEGEIKIAIGARDRIVFIDFGSPCTWIGLPPEKARELATSLMVYATMAEGQ